MRALLLAAALGGCTVPLTRGVGLYRGFDGRVSHHANAARPRSYVGLRLSLTRHPGSPMRLFPALRRICARHPFRRPAPSAPTMNTLIADNTRRLRAMEPPRGASHHRPGQQAARHRAEVASEVFTLEAAKDAQRATDIAAISAAVTGVANGVGARPAPAADVKAAS